MRFFRTVVCCSLCILTSLAAQAADEPGSASPPPAPVQAIPAPQLKAAPGLSLLHAPAETPQAAASPRIGVVDLSKVSAESSQGKAAQARVKEQQARLQKQIESKKKQIEKFKADTERQLPGLSPQQREAKQKEFQKRVEDFQKFGMNAEKELMAVQEKLTRELFESIGKAAEQLGKETGVAAIVINRELLYLGAGTVPVDLTADLVKLLDAGQGTKK